MKVYALQSHGHYHMHHLQLKFTPARQQALDRVRVVIGPEDLQGPVPGAHPLARDKLF